MNYILRTYNLKKEFIKTTAVDNLNMNIQKGDIYGFLGQNGAGKTTTIAMIMSLLRPTEGDIEIFGINIKESGNKIYGNIGSMIEGSSFYPKLNAFENLEIHRRMIGHENRNRVIEVLKVVGLYNDAGFRVMEYSLGMKQRLGIARAILHCPEFLVLDEPINGLDPIGIKEMRDLIIDLNKKCEVTFLISSHILSEMQQIASKIGIIHNGQLLEELDYSKLEERNTNYLIVKLDDSDKASAILKDNLSINNFKIIDKGEIRINERVEEAPYINKMLVENGCLIRELVMRTDSLEDYFIKITEGGKALA